MTISVVNGYICTSCSDVSKAKKGENPHPVDRPGGVEGARDREPGALRDEGPAVVFGGRLAELSRVDRVEPVAALSEIGAIGRSTGARVDRLV
jgi:hypothetical protein